MERSRLTQCKTCGAEIAASAKFCPHCGAKVRKSRALLIIIPVLIIIIIAAMVGSGGKDDEPKKIEAASTVQPEAAISSETDAPAKTEKPADTESPAKTVKPADTESPAKTVKPAEMEEKNEFLVGETAELNGITASMVSVTESSGSSYNWPTEGNVFLICEFEIANNSNSEINISSMMSFNAYCDDYACNYSISALMEKGDKNQLDGTVAPGKKINGVIGYEVPADWQEIEIHFTPDLWREKDITFIGKHE